MRAVGFLFGVVAITTASFAACSSKEDTATSNASDASASDAGAVDAAPACVLDQVSLDIETSGGHPTRLHMPITYQDAAAYLLFDMGSDSTFLTEPLGSPDPTPDAAVFQIGCLALGVYGRPVVAEAPLHGVPCVGTAGTDLMLTGNTKIDFAAKNMLFHAHGESFAEAASWPNAPFDDVEGLVLAHVTLDGQAVRLEVDTGSQDTLLVGAQPKPGDQEVDTTDALGNPLKLYVGTALLEVGGTQMTVPILRAPSFPYFEQGVKDLGGNIQGLFGLSSMGSGIVVDTDANALRVDF